ncbi:MAG TPA: glycosyltransferase [Solirubrobacteraceae bacterium]
MSEIRRSEEPRAGRVVVTAVGDPVHGQLAESRFVDRPFLYGGEHNLYQIAFAAASLGYEVELRGWLHRPSFDQLSRATGVEPRAEMPARKPEPDDVVVVPEGWRNPLDYARLVLSPARLVMAILAAPGLFGWPFVADPWEPPDPLTVRPDRLARPEHFRGMDALGLTLVSSSPGLVAAAQAAGVECAFLGTGLPSWAPPPPVEKTVDVAALLDNRWAGLAEQVLSELDGLTVDRIETVSNEELVARLARARTLVWPSRIEGQARISWEARSVGTVPVALGSNPFAVGLDEAHGAVVVDDIEEIARAIRSLLADEPHRAELSRLGRETAPAEVSWEPYVERVAAFLAGLRGRGRDPSRAPLAGMGRALDAELAELAREHQRRLEELAAAGRDLTEATHNQERMTAESAHWRALFERASAETEELRMEVDSLRAENERLAAELRALLARRSVKAALRVADTVRRRDD